MSNDHSDPSTLDRLQAWYLSQCDGEWEHGYGIVIDTLDNPGWKLKVDLNGTSSEGAHFDAIETRRSENDWIVCRIKTDRFEAFGGPQNLEEMISIFLNFADRTKS